MEKQEKDFAHFPVSENTQDYLAHPLIPNNQESRTAQDNYRERRAVLESSDLRNSTVTKSDYPPVCNTVLLVRPNGTSKRYVLPVCSTSTS